MDNSVQTDRLFRWLWTFRKNGSMPDEKPFEKLYKPFLYVAVFIGLLALVALVLRILLFPSQAGFDIVASLIPQENATWSLRGRALLDGSPLDKALIWAVLKDTKGNRDSPPMARTDSTGGFVIEPIPTKIAENDVAEVTVYGQQPSSSSVFGWLQVEAKGEEVLVIGHGPLRRVKFSIWALIIPPAIFLVSLSIAFWGGATAKAYGLSILCAFLLTVVTIVEISSGLSYVHTTGDKNEILSLGYASIFRGQYVKDIEPEWLFSLTAPRELSRIPGAPRAAVDSAPPLVRGFGAPLWVLLLAVVGVGLRTIMIIVNAISQRPDFTNPAAIQSRIEVLVRHQLFMLFAPLGAIFVYQFLVMAESATQPAAVALISLGAGLTLTTLIERALTQAEEVVQRTAVTTGAVVAQETVVTGAGTDAQTLTLTKELAKTEETVVTRPTTDAGASLPKEATGAPGARG